MIIIGYPGIGKSTLAGRYKEYVDLESSNWCVDTFKNITIKIFKGRMIND